MSEVLTTDPAALSPSPRAPGSSGAFRRGEHGATMVEYALMLALIAIVAMAAVQSTGLSAREVFEAASVALGAEGGGGGGNGGNNGGGNGGGNGQGGGNGGCGTQC